MEKSLKDYCESVSCFCYYFVFSRMLIDRYDEGTLNNASVFDEALSGTEKYHKELRKARKALGLAEELRFLKGEYNFMGFSIKDGSFKGDCAEVPKVVDRWYRELKKATPEHVTEELAFRFEIAVLSYMYAGVAKELFNECHTEKRKKHFWAFRRRAG